MPRNPESSNFNIKKLKKQYKNLETSVILSNLDQNTKMKEGYLLKIEGTGASNPTIHINKNISTVTRTGIGTYNITLTQESIGGQNVLDNSVFTVAKSITPAVSTDLFDVNFKKLTSDSFEITVKQITVPSGVLTFTLYDLVSTDFLYLSAILQ